MQKGDIDDDHHSQDVASDLSHCGNAGAHVEEVTKSRVWRRREGPLHAASAGRTDLSLHLPPGFNFVASLGPNRAVAGEIGRLDPSFPGSLATMTRLPGTPGHAGDPLVGVSDTDTPGAYRQHPSRAQQNAAEHLWSNQYCHNHQ